MLRFSPDDDIRNADWAKTQYWDLPDDPSAFTQDELEDLSQLPAWEAAPLEIRSTTMLSTGVVADLNPFYREWEHPRGHDGKWIEVGNWIDVDAPKGGWFDGEPNRKRRAKILELTEKGPRVQYTDSDFPDLIDLPDVSKRVSSSAKAKATLPPAKAEPPKKSTGERDPMPYELHTMTADQVTKDTPGADQDLVSFYWPYKQRMAFINSWKEEYPEAYETMEKILPTTSQFVDPETTELMIAIPAARMAAILKQKRFKSAFETTSGIGKGVKGYKKTRKGYEDTVAGIPMGIENKMRPIYGFVEGVPPGNDTQQYGLIKAVLHERVRGRTTISFGDTLNIPGTKPLEIDKVDGASTDDLLAAGLNAPVARHVQDMNVYTTTELTKEKLGNLKPSDYVEAQFHGGVSLKDVKKFIVKRDSLEKSLLNAGSSPGLAAEYQTEMNELDTAIEGITNAGHEIEVLHYDPESIVSQNGIKPKVGQYIKNPETGQIVRVTDVSGARDRLTVTDNKGQKKTTYTDFVDLYEEDPGFATAFASAETKDGIRARIGDYIAYEGETYSGKKGIFTGMVKDIKDTVVDVDWDAASPNEYYIDFEKFKENASFKKKRETFKDKNNKDFHIRDNVVNPDGHRGQVLGYNPVQNTFEVKWDTSWKSFQVPADEIVAEEAAEVT